MSAAEKIYQQEVAQEGQIVPSVVIPHQDRWIWYKAVLRADPKVLTPTTKVVLLVIFDAVDKKSGIATRYIEQLAKDAGGLTERGAWGCIQRAFREGYIHIENRGGGLVWMDSGEVKGIPCRYRTALPRTAVPGSDPDTQNGGDRHIEPPCQIHRTAMSDTQNGGSDNTPTFSPNRSPNISPARGTGYGTPFNGGAVAKSVSLSGEKMEHVSPSSPMPETDGAVEMESEANIEPDSPSSPEAARATLPVADMRMRAAWGNRWPGERKLVESAPTMDIAPSRLICDAMRLLGFSNAEIVDAEAPPGSGYREYFDFLEGTIDREHRKELARQMIDGRLKMVTLANVLAYYGFTPKE